MSTEQQNEVPDWATWTAMDSDGSWWWYEKKPHRPVNRKYFYARTGRRRIVWPNQPEEVEDWIKSVCRIKPKQP